MRVGRLPLHIQRSAGCSARLSSLRRTLARYSSVSARLGSSEVTAAGWLWHPVLPWFFQKSHLDSRKVSWLMVHESTVLYFSAIRGYNTLVYQLLFKEEEEEAWGISHPEFNAIFVSFWFLIDKFRKFIDHNQSSGSSFFVGFLPLLLVWLVFFVRLVSKEVSL